MKVLCHFSNEKKVPSMRHTQPILQCWQWHWHLICGLAFRSIHEEGMAQRQVEPKVKSMVWQEMMSTATKRQRRVSIKRVFHAHDLSWAPSVTYQLLPPLRLACSRLQWRTQVTKRKSPTECIASAKSPAMSCINSRGRTLQPRSHFCCNPSQKMEGKPDATFSATSGVRCHVTSYAQMQPTSIPIAQVLEYVKT
jgi:hypothetical protein